MVENNSFNVRSTAAFTVNGIERAESKVKHSFHCIPWCCENCIREKTSHYGANVILFLTPSKEIEVREFQLIGITKQSRLHRCSRTVPSTSARSIQSHSLTLADLAEDTLPRRMGGVTPTMSATMNCTRWPERDARRAAWPVESGLGHARSRYNYHGHVASPSSPLKVPSTDPSGTATVQPPKSPWNSMVNVTAWG